MGKIGMNTAEVLANVEKLLEEAQEYKDRWNLAKKYSLREVCTNLSVFDYFPEELSVSGLKQMRMFLKNAAKLGYNGYACFKVGATGTANGMWAHKKESETGYSPDGACLYHSFTPEANYWDCQFPDGRWLSSMYEDRYMFSLKEIKEALKKYGEQNDVPAGNGG